MIYYQSPRPYLIAHNQDQPLKYEPDKGFFIPDWDKSLGEQPGAETVDSWKPPEPSGSPVREDSAAALDVALAAKIEASKTGTQGEKIAALTGGMEEIRAALKAAGILPTAPPLPRP